MSGGRPLRLGAGACILHRDPQRAIFKNKPLLYLEQELSEWAMREGAMVVMLPLLSEAPAAAPSLDVWLDQLDGLLLQGGADVAPGSYGEAPLRPEWRGDAARDAYEMALVRRCLERDIPIFGSCRGVQVLNVALGGTMHQDIPTQVPGARVHRDWDIYDTNVHPIEIPAGSWLSGVYGGATSGVVNSVHHQAIKDVAPGLRVEATSLSDGIIEAVFLEGGDAGGPFAAGVQWHPEWTAAGPASQLDPRPLMSAFLAAVRARAR